MNKTVFFSLSFFLFAFLLSSQDFSEQGRTTKQIHFRENKGQVSDQFFNPRPDILFSGNSDGMAFHLRSNGISYQLSRVDQWKENRLAAKLPVTSGAQKLLPALTTIYRLDINWLQADNTARIIHGEAISGYDNYYLASCPDGALNARSFTEVTYKDLYEGIDLKWYEKNANLKYDYHVAAHTDYKKIQLEYKGAGAITVNNAGELVITTPLGTLKEQKPLVMQNNKILPAGWAVKGSIVSFEIKNVDPSLPLVIDPMVRLWATYYGGADSDETFHVNADAAGNVYVSGQTISTGNIATTGAHQTSHAGVGSYDGFLVKFNAAGVRQWATYYGGTGEDFGYDSDVDAGGNIYMAGTTTSSNTGVIATPGAHQTTYTSATNNLGDGFLVMFDASGVRQWGTYYGGDQDDFAIGLCLDNSGGIYITGGAESPSGIATPGSHQPNPSMGADAFLAKFDQAGVRQWATYYGGYSAAWDCINNPAGDVYICGRTSYSAGIATPGCHQPVYGGGPTFSGDGFYAKFNTNGVLQWGTYYGGPGSEQANNLTLDAAGNLYGAGNCSAVSGTAVATPGCHQPVYGGGIYDGYLVKFDPSGVRLWGTFYGGPGLDVAGGPGVDASGNVFISGLTSTSSGTVIATDCAYQSQYAGGSQDMFLAKFTSTGARMWGTYYGSIYSENGVGSCADAGGNIYICGVTLAGSGTVMASGNGHQPVYGGGPSDVALAKFDGCIPGSAANMTPPSNLLVCAGESTTLTATCGNWYSSPAGTAILGTGGTFTTGALSSDTTFYVEDFGCGSITGTRTAVSVTLVPSNLTVSNSNPLACVGESVTLSASGASSYTWTGPSGSSSTPTLQVYILLHSNYSVTATDTEGCVSTATIAVIPDLCLGIKENEAATAIAVYPNPNNGAFYIAGLAEQKLVLINELGQEIKKIALISSNNFTVRLDELPNGVYFIKGEKDKHVLNKKIIVIR